MTEATKDSSGDPPVTPVSIERNGDAAIVITWSDGKVTAWTAQRLRDGCPCATCREKRRGKADDLDSGKDKPPMLPVLSAAEARPLRIEAMTPVGCYAYSISFSDGHSSGIYPFEMLYAPP